MLTRVAASVASLASGAEGAAVGRGAVTADVAELAAGVTLHGLGLAITRVVVGAFSCVRGACWGGRERTYLRTCSRWQGGQNRRKHQREERRSQHQRSRPHAWVGRPWGQVGRRRSHLGSCGPVGGVSFC